MELEAASRRAQLVRMDDQDRVSQASSVATISYFPVMKETDGKVQTFGKRCQAAKRDPNCAVVIRGWLNKKDSSGLKLWKRRWFVLSNYCLFYYKDSREESVLGSIPLPSYKILFCTPRECKNRKFTFKVVHQGMRSYFFSADTQEDMLGWVRALSQSAAMEPDSSLNRRCSSYQDFTQIGGSTESVDSPKSPSDGEGPSQKHRNISRTLSEPSHLTGGRMGASYAEHRGRRSTRQRYSRTPSPPEFSRRRMCGLNQEEDSLPGQNTPPMHGELLGTGSLTSRGQLGSRPHTPVGRVDIRPHDDSAMVPQTLYYAPGSPQLEFKSTPTTPVSERWQKPVPTYGSIHHVTGGRRPLGKSQSTGVHADLLPPLPPSSRAAHGPHPPHHHHHHHHHHHRSNVSVCVLPSAMGSKPDPRENPQIRPLESDADAVLTRLCGCDKLLQSLSLELAQLQMDKDSVHCALDVSRLQLEEWKSQGPRAHEEALTQKALLQEELVTIRARMCDVSLEMERVWSQYERMESELSVIRSHLQHICNFGAPQEQSQAQRELWMMEDILAGLKINRDHFCFLMGIQRHHKFQSTAPHPGSPGSPTERLQGGLPMDLDQEPPVRPPLPQELQEAMGQGHEWIESPYEGIYSHAVDPVQRRGNSQPDLLNVKAQRDTFESEPKWMPPDTTNQSTKKMKMSEEEQIERMKRNQERMTNRKKSPSLASGAQSQNQGSDAREEAPFPLRVTRVVTAVLPSSLVARRVSVEDPPPELDSPLPEQIQPEMQQRLAEQSKKLLSKPPRRLLLESAEQSQAFTETHPDQPVQRTNRQQHLQGVLRSSKRESRSEARRAELMEVTRNQVRDRAGLGSGSTNQDIRTEERPSARLNPGVDPEPSLTPEQREAKLRRVERIRERVIRSTVRESATTHSQQIREGPDVHRAHPDTARKQRVKSDHESYHSYESCGDNARGPAELHLSSGASQDEDEREAHVKTSRSRVKFGNKTQDVDHGGKTGVAKTKSKRPGSPYHVTSMTVFQKDGAKGYTSRKEEEATADDNEGDYSSSDLRAKWFLSTNQWQGFIRLQIPGTDSESAEAEDQAASTDDANESNEMSSAVSESLEKMKENHSLFYKIACDISISDTDITKNDVNSNGQTSSAPEDEQEQPSVIQSVSEEASHNENQKSEDFNLHLPSDDNENSLPIDTKLQDSTVQIQDKGELNTSASPAKDVCVSEETTKQESNLEEGGETIQGAPAQSSDSNQALDEKVKTREEDSVVKRSEERKAGRVRAEQLKKCRSFSEESKEAVQERGNGHSVTPSIQGGSVIRSASFGNARVTVLRTSF